MRALQDDNGIQFPGSALNRINFMGVYLRYPLPCKPGHLTQMWRQNRRSGPLLYDLEVLAHGGDSITVDHHRFRDLLGQLSHQFLRFRLQRQPRAEHYHINLLGQFQQGIFILKG